MNKLTHIRKVLQNNSNITIVGAPEQNHLSDGNNCTVDFHVAPKTGGVYTAEKLQALMMSLVPGLEPTCKDDFCEEDSWDSMRFGVLYFDENVGTETIRCEIVLTDEDVFSSSGFINGKRITKHTKKIYRRIWVRLFPNARIAAAALKDENRHGISKRELIKYRGGVITRLVNAFA